MGYVFLKLASEILLPVRWPGLRAEAQVCQAKELALYLRGTGQLLKGVRQRVVLSLHLFYL